VELFQREYKNRLADAAISHLRHLITEPRKDFYEPAISLKGDYPNMLALGHYRNKIVHLFFREGLWACALYSFNETTDIHEHRVDRQLLQREVAFLHEMLQLEFIWKEHPDEPEDFDMALVQLVQHGILKITSDNLVEVAPTGEGMFSFLCALFWPFIDSYFVAAMTLASLQPALQMDQTILLQRTQWLATTLYHESMLCFYESCSLETLSNALQTLARWKVVSITKAPPTVPTSFGGVVKKKSGDKFIVSLLPPYNTDEALQDLVSRIGRLRKQPLARKSLLRRNLIADIPILAKL
jgi:glycerol-3-phosphate O-acyltransferase